VCAAALAAATMPPPVPAQDPARRSTATFTVAAEDSSALTRSGDPAPDFGFRAHDGRWRTLSDLLAVGDLLLVMGADEDGLRRLETERAGLVGAGVVPVAVLDQPSVAVWRLAHRLGLGYSVLSDPQHQLAGEWGAVDPATGHTARAWFVVDRRGRVRASGRGPAPVAGWTALAAHALGRPLTGAPRTAGAD
jgi:peroxiredoxin